jgi:hypothetical protein
MGHNYYYTLKRELQQNPKNVLQKVCFLVFYSKKNLRKPCRKTETITN